MTQNEMILKHLQEFGSITSKEAMSEYGVMRLASRISDLKADGFPIKSSTESAKNRFGKTVTYARYEYVR